LGKDDYITKLLCNNAFVLKFASNSFYIGISIILLPVITGLAVALLAVLLWCDSGGGGGSCLIGGSVMAEFLYGLSIISGVSLIVTLPLGAALILLSLILGIIKRISDK
jgi:hypothetical protein